MRERSGAWGWGTHLLRDRRKAHEAGGRFTRQHAVAVVLLQRLGPVRVGHARVRTRAPLEHLAEELLPSLAVCLGPLISCHVARPLLLRRRRMQRGTPARRFVVGLRDARRGRQAGGGGIRRLVCARGPACGLGRVRAACGRSMRDRGGRARRAAATRSAHPCRPAWRPASRGWGLGLSFSQHNALPTRHLRPPT